MSNTPRYLPPSTPHLKVKATRASMVVRWSATSAAVAALMLGCGDSSLAPTATKPSMSKVTTVGLISGSNSGSGSWNSGSGSGGTDTTVSVMTVNPLSRAMFNIGDHKLFFPPNSVCDPALSSYGPSEWDMPCTPISAPLTITAKTWTNESGHAQISFSPALRFVPSALPWQAVTLYLKDRYATAATNTIVWCDDAGVCVDESIADPTEATMDDPTNGFIYRRIKHFSGYNVAARADVVEEY
jgi:hypothetical protein